MANKGGGSARLGRDSQPKYLGIKITQGQKVKPGMIIIRQRGTEFLPGKNVKKGKDFTLYSMIEGLVSFRKKAVQRFDSSRKIKKIVNVEPLKEKK
jgi:large subunit ribosomal protein L27